ncbi:DUF1772 domain-containing protein [Stagonosporopsis vannaccii]|nr:DUF1772 domain-containing protein [Stagonosporopsis vannaccii]
MDSHYNGPIARTGGLMRSADPHHNADTKGPKIPLQAQWTPPPSQPRNSSASQVQRGYPVHPPLPPRSLSPSSFSLSPLTPRPRAPESPSPDTAPTGTITSLSLVSVPAIVQSVQTAALPPLHAARLWRATFEAGFALAPPVAVVTASSLVFAGWTARSQWYSRSVSAGRRGGANWSFVAAALTVGIVPFTILFMKETNERLLEFAAREGLTRAEEGEVVEFLGRWKVLNGVRGMLPFVAAVVVGVALGA